MIKPAFQPAPRPRPRISPEDAQQLAVATSDLGFTRPSSAPEVRAEEPVPPPAETMPTAGPVAQEPKTPIAPVKGTALKFEVPDPVWTALRQEALNRRVTVKYLVLEALAAKGYNVDLAAVPEDGRRLR
ncbi:hypothetical protein GOFOIKOB_6466 [Methylobacterium tardum]|uniref:Uncharacterized protein n=1 Tax=Methylobacterium tardum TaxID=374432 RepID=A0AA37TRS7_9HYPH|nr:hypothetical protein [Methylobacterium tardum]URD40262.1 hypothetical protein M6G65_33235 [Methylobacterium tardum]GJE53387.1 hypothetical protein GOFOIKOB_6466 [Methylobacterium tardum]GLS74597.1 hypothetical protein GCM10007890_66150 [Methylobacterium tardum]